jgi:hypothetical protein
VLSVIGIAVAVTTRSKAFAFAALGLVLAGTIAEFAGIATLTVTVARSSDAVLYEIGRIGSLASHAGGAPGSTPDTAGH